MEELEAIVHKSIFKNGDYADDDTKGIGGG